MTGFGLNCDEETAYALELAGASAQKVHMNDLIHGNVSLDDFQILAFIGGFGWADDHGAGVIQAVRLKTRIGDALLRFIERGNLIIGICNGFQVLVNLGLLPGFDHDYTARCLALTYNDCGNFRDDWVGLAVNPQSPCVFTKGMEHLELPIRHGEGKFVADKEMIRRLEQSHQVTLRYTLPDGSPANGTFPYNPNGSLNDIAGVCDPTGRVFGLMPHPEAFNHFTNHPDWTRWKKSPGKATDKLIEKPTPGIQLSKNAVDYFQN